MTEKKKDATKEIMIMQAMYKNLVVKVGDGEEEQTLAFSKGRGIKDIKVPKLETIKDFIEDKYSQDPVYQQYRDLDNVKKLYVLKRLRSLILHTEYKREDDPADFEDTFMERYIETNKLWVSDAPYFSEFLFRIRPKAEKKSQISTMGILAQKGKIELFYRPLFALCLTERELQGVFVHEIGHVVTNTFQRKGWRNHGIFNIASDVCINEGIKTTKINTRELELPIGWDKNTKYMKNFDELLTYEIVHDYIIREDSRRFKKKPVGKKDDKITYMDGVMEMAFFGKNKGKIPFFGKNKSATVTEVLPSNGEPIPAFTDEELETAQKELNAISEKLKEKAKLEEYTDRELELLDIMNDEGDLDSEEGEGDGDGDGEGGETDQEGRITEGMGKEGALDDHRRLNESEIDEQTRHIIEETHRAGSARGWGNITGTMDEYIKSITRSKRDWKSELRRSVKSTFNKLIRKASWNRESRRHPNLKGRVKEGFGVVVAIDVSGSVTHYYQLLDVFFGEIDRISQTAKITLVQFDTEIKYCQPYKKNKWKSVPIDGGGGTDPQCIFDRFEGDKKTIVILTDGEFSENIDTKGLNIIWFIVNDDTYKMPTSMGKTIWIKRSDVQKK